MPTLLIQDFLQTQGLKLPTEDIRIAYAAAQAVINMGSASIERSLLWPEKETFKLSQHIEPTAENEALLKQIFMALDSVYSRQPNVKSAAIYAHMPSETSVSKLVLLSQQGHGLETLLDVDDANSQIYLASRTAQSGWMNVANDIPYWLTLNEMTGQRNAQSMAQVSIPVCTPSGSVTGVLHIEFKETNQADHATLCEWVALSLALATPLNALLGVSGQEEEHND